MADEKHESGGNPMETLMFVILGLVILGALWVANGGPDRAREKNDGIFLNPPPPLGDGTSYGPGQKPVISASTTNTYPTY